MHFENDWTVIKIVRDFHLTYSEQLSSVAVNKEKTLLPRTESQGGKHEVKERQREK